MTTTLKTIENKKDDPTLSDAQKFVGGWVEVVKLNNGILIVNEEGKIKQLEYNEPASKLYAESYGDLDIIFGPAIYIPNNVPSQWHG